MHLTYLAVLVFVLVGSGWLELVLRVGVWRRTRRLVLTLLPVIAVFVVWDVYAIREGHWTFDPERTTGLFVGVVPVEELLFFVLVPIAGVMTYEAVRAVNPHWPGGDEAPDATATPAESPGAGLPADPGDSAGTTPGAPTATTVVPGGER